MRNTRDFKYGSRLALIDTISRMSSKASNKRSERKKNENDLDHSDHHDIDDQRSKQKSSRRSPAMRRRANARMDSHCAKLSEQHDAKEKRRIYDESMFGFKSEVEMMRALQIVTFPKSVIVPITFRSAGFMCQFLFCKFAVLRIRMPLCSVYELFHVTLLQLEARLDASMREQCSRNVDDDTDFVTLRITIEQLRIVSTLRANIAPLANIIHNQGLIKGFNTDYILRIAAPLLQNGLRAVEPTGVYFSSLQWNVTKMADGRTSLQQREYFYVHNPLPGARWRGSRTRTIPRRGQPATGTLSRTFSRS